MLLGQGREGDQEDEDLWHGIPFLVDYGFEAQAHELGGPPGPCRTTLPREALEKGVVFPSRTLRAVGDPL
jgi:hypothetical protein